MSHAAGAQVIQCPSNGGANQRWQRGHDVNRDVHLTHMCTHRARGVTLKIWR